MQSFILVADVYSKTRLCPDIARLSYHETLEKYLKLIRDDEVKGPRKKDCKSLTQCLFDTAAMKLFQGAHMQTSGQGHLLNPNEDDQFKEIRHISGTRSDCSNTDATESANSRRRNRSKKRPAHVSDHEWPEQPKTPSPKDSLNFPAAPNDVMNRKQPESIRSEKRSCVKKPLEKLSRSRNNYISLGQHTDEERCLACQRKPQLYGHARVLQYMSCELVEDIRHLLSLEESQGNLENHFKVCK